VNDIGYPDPYDRAQIGVEIHIGKNRIVRRLFEHFGYTVEKLDRVMYAGLTKKDLPRGKHRILKPMEVMQLRKIGGGK
jgi:23S rRNA pseudouridine2605 synthase